MDFAQLIKSYGDTPDQDGPERRYSPGVCTGVSKRKIVGNPAREHVSTSYVESHNQKILAHMRRFTRLTAGHSKKFSNHCHALALYFMYYNFVKIHGSLRTSPATAAKIETRLWDMSDIAAAMDARAPKPGPRADHIGSNPISPKFQLRQCLKSKVRRQPAKKAGPGRPASYSDFAIQ